MERDNNFLILTFDSTHHAMRAEDVLKENELSIKTIPTPRDITLSCGLAIRANILDKDKIIYLYNEKKLDFINLYEISILNNERFLKKII
ncbi:MAG: DUF3343 domain-containing protein [Tissierellales bacterium]|nr:DUF3343 domain-containing protein [Tissierellales bacterium]